jgi:putative membrane protein
VGLLSFAKVISWLLKHYYNLTIALLAGFMIGSLNKIWPWKVVTLYRLDSRGIPVPLIDKNVLPTQYTEQTGIEPHIMGAIIFMLLGIALVFFIDKFASKKTTTLAKARR